MPGVSTSDSEGIARSRSGVRDPPGTSLPRPAALAIATNEAFAAEAIEASK
jgi:hypothetical protein